MPVLKISIVFLSIYVRELYAVKSLNRLLQLVRNKREFDQLTTRSIQPVQCLLSSIGFGILKQVCHQFNIVFNQVFSSSYFQQALISSS